MSFSPAQEAYMVTKAYLETLQAERDRQMKAAGFELTRGMSEADLEAYCDAECDIEEQLHITEAMDAHFDAKQALLDWSKAKIAKEMAGHPQLDEALSVYDRVKFLPSLREKLIETAMRQA